MGRTGTAERRNENFVQWKEPVQSSGKQSSAHGTASTSTVRNNKQTRRQKSLLSSLEATIQGPQVEDELNATIPSVVVTETGVGTPASSPPELHTSDPPPRFRPPGQSNTTRSTKRRPAAGVSVGTTEHAADMQRDGNNCRTTQIEAVSHDSDFDEQEEQETAGQQQRRATEGKVIHPLV